MTNAKVVAETDRNAPGDTGLVSGAAAEHLSTDNQQGVREALVDLRTHRANWRHAIEQTIKACPTPTDESDDAQYWKHELAVFDRTFAALAQSPANRGDREPFGWMEPVRYEFGGSLVEKFRKGAEKPLGWSQWAFPVYAAPDTPESAGTKSEGERRFIDDCHEIAEELRQEAKKSSPSPAFPGAGVRDVWPSGCHSPGSCTRHKQCMYVNCRYEGTDIKDAILSALSDRAGAEKT